MARPDAVQPHQAVADAGAHLGVLRLLRREGAGRDHQAEVGGDVEVGQLQGGRRPGDGQVGVLGQDGDDDAVVPHRDDLAPPRGGARPVGLALGDRPALAVGDHERLGDGARRPRRPPGPRAGWSARSAAAPGPRTTSAPSGSGTHSVRSAKARSASSCQSATSRRAWSTWEGLDADPRVRRSERLLMVLRAVGGRASLALPVCPSSPDAASLSVEPARPEDYAAHRRADRPRLRRRRLASDGYAARAGRRGRPRRARRAARRPRRRRPGGRQRRAGAERRLRRGHRVRRRGGVPDAGRRPGGAGPRRRRAAGDHLPGPGAGRRQAPHGALDRSADDRGAPALRAAGLHPAAGAGLVARCPASTCWSTRCDL